MKSFANIDEVLSALWATEDRACAEETRANSNWSHIEELHRSIERIGNSLGLTGKFGADFGYEQVEAKSAGSVPKAELAALRDRILDLVVDDAKTFSMLVIVADEIAELAGIPTAEFDRSKEASCAP